MKVFTDGVHFFSTDKYLKNLKEIEINSIKEYVDSGLCWTVLVEASELGVGRFDEIKAVPLNGAIDEDEAEFIAHSAHSAVFVDFCLDVPHLDVMHQLNDLIAFDLDLLLDDLKGSSIKASEYWPDDETQIVKLSALLGDTRTLELKEDSDGKIICEFV